MSNKNLNRDYEAERSKMVNSATERRRRELEMQAKLRKPSDLCDVEDCGVRRDLHYLENHMFLEKARKGSDICGQKGCNRRRDLHFGLGHKFVN